MQMPHWNIENKLQNEIDLEKISEELKGNKKI